MKLLSIIAYFLIFLQGMMIQIPFGLLLISGLLEAEPLTRFFIILADITLIILLIISSKEKTKTTLLIEAVSFFILLLPLLRIFISFPFEMFNYFLFLFPSGCFVILYPLSVFISYREYIKKKSPNQASTL